MTELLAPGVYTIETSFRPRSIQGVGTSTTAFVGLARSGPVGGAPQLVTSYSEFERIYGGLGDLAAANLAPAEPVNYLAHAVRAFFGEGGARLYISRVFAAVDGVNTGRGALALPAGATDLVLRTRFAGTGSNGTIAADETLAPVTTMVRERAAVGTLARTRGSPATPARLTAGTAPGALQAGATLSVAVNGAAAVVVNFPATRATATAQAAPVFPLALPAGSTLAVVADGLRQLIPLPAAVASEAALRNAINATLQRATAGFAGGRLVIESAAAGSAVRVAVEQFDAVGFTAPQTEAAGTGVSRLDRITAADVAAQMAAVNLNGVRVETVAGGALSLVSTGDGAGQTLDIGATAAATRSALGFAPGTTAAAGSAGTEMIYFIRTLPAAVGWQRHRRDTATGRWLADGAVVDGAVLDGGNGFIVGVNLSWTSVDGVLVSYEDMSLVEAHNRYIGKRLRTAKAGEAEPVGDPLVLTATGVNGAEFHARLFANAQPDANSVLRQTHVISTANDGSLPGTAAWEAAIETLNRYDDIAIVAAPGSSAYPEGAAVMRQLIGHAELSGYRIAVIDTPPAQDMVALRETRGQIDSSYAALYAPWTRISNPLARPGNESIPREIFVPPSGHIAGIYARNDQLRGVHKTPANEVIRSALGFEVEYNQSQQGVLNPIGINCLRTIKGRGARVYGGRLATSDREVVYVSDRRYLNFVKRSIYESMQWAVFEPNGPFLWSNVREAVASFLYNQWFNGALFGASTDEAYFVVCDGSVMTQADLDNGRMICEIGLALLKPAEFVVFRIGQKTADQRR
ncbi:MAG: phage tail sheath subtilisin-like domain-containing protein [Rhizobiaceae bacterium]